MLTPIDLILSAALSLGPYIINVRNHIHQNPELRWEEENTIAFILSKLKEIRIDPSLELKILPMDGGLVIDLLRTGSSHEDRRLFRADLDALPIQEETGLPFASKTNGKMHACGHDVHPAMLLGALKLLAEGGIKPVHNIRFVFQQAEENPITLSGGATLVGSGVLENVSDVHMLHVWPDAMPGTFLSRPGAMLANSDRVKVSIQTTGGHVAYPNQGSSAADIATDILMAMRGFGERFFEPGEQYSFLPAIIQVGKASNVRPGEGELWFSARNFRFEDGRDNFAKAIKERIKAVVLGYPDAVVDVEYVRGHPMLFNTEEDVSRVGELLRKFGMTVEEIRPSSGGEDFAHYLKQRTGSAWMIGVGQKGSGPIHSSTFNPDEKAFTNGVAFWLLLATQ